VLAGDSGGTSETLVNGQTGVICDCTTPESIAAKLHELFSKPALMASMGQKGRAHTKENFSWLALTNRAIKVFQ
jgi:phosphatidylinositol alpha-1,6-mannosyltransferase